MNYAKLTDAAVAVLPLARTDAELDDWWKESQAWIRRLKANAPDQYARLVEAGKAHRAKLARRDPTSRIATSIRF